jgi:hypothetical protein
VRRQRLGFSLTELVLSMRFFFLSRSERNHVIR